MSFINAKTIALTISGAIVAVAIGVFAIAGQPTSEAPAQATAVTTPAPAVETIAISAPKTRNSVAACWQQTDHNWDLSNEQQNLLGQAVMAYVQATGLDYTDCQAMNDGIRLPNGADVDATQEAQLQLVADVKSITNWGFLNTSTSNVNGIGIQLSK